MQSEADAPIFRQHHLLSCAPPPPPLAIHHHHPPPPPPPPPSLANNSHHYLFLRRQQPFHLLPMPPPRCSTASSSSSPSTFPWLSSPSPSHSSHLPLQHHLLLDPIPHHLAPPPLFPDLHTIAAADPLAGATVLEPALNMIYSCGLSLADSTNPFVNSACCIPEPAVATAVPASCTSTTTDFCPLPDCLRYGSTSETSDAAPDITKQSASSSSNSSTLIIEQKPHRLMSLSSSRNSNVLSKTADVDHSPDHMGSTSSSISSSSSVAAAPATAPTTAPPIHHVDDTLNSAANPTINSSAATAAPHCATNSCEIMPYDYDYNPLQMQGGRCSGGAGGGGAAFEAIPLQAASSPNCSAAGCSDGPTSSGMVGMTGGGANVEVGAVMMVEEAILTRNVNNKRRKKRKRGGGADGNGGDGEAAPPHSSSSSSKNSKKNREELEHQRMTHIAVERNRRRQMNIHLAALRAIMPSSYVQRGDQASIVGGAIRFVEELEQLVQCLHLQKQLRAQNNVDTLRPLSHLTTPTQEHYDHLHMDTSQLPFHNATTLDDITSFHLRDDSYAASSSPVASIEVNVIAPSTIFLKVLAPKKPHQLLHTISALTTLYLKVMQLNVTAMDANTILFSFNLQMDGDYQLQTPNELVEVIQNILGAHDNGRCENITY